MRFFVTSLALLALGVSAAQANLLTNGSFEQPGTSPFSTENPIPGWTATTGTVETGLGSIYGVTGYDGNYVCELDAFSNSTIQQTFTLRAFTPLYVSFLYGQRGGTTPETNSFAVYLNGIQISSFTPDSTAMQTFSFIGSGLAGTNTISFEATGTSDSYGGIIDNVTVATPAPGAAVSALCGGVVAMRRRRRAKA